MSNTHEKDPANVARGLKSAINNPRVSEEAKQRDIERLEEMGESVPGQVQTEDIDDEASTRRLRSDQGHSAQSDNYDESNPNRVLGGYKATLSNPRTSQAAKEHAEQVLEANDA